MKKQLLLTALAISSCSAAFARPVSYPEGWTAMQMHDKDETSLHVHYSPTINYSVGYKHSYLRNSDTHISSVQLNNLVKRWNMPEAQANFYVKSGVGVAYNEHDSSAAAYSGIALDVEDRRYFASYENRLRDAGDFDDSFKQTARVGVAPYVAPYGSLHTWLMLQADHNPEDKKPVHITPLVRFFKGETLVEAGARLDGGLLFNVIQRF